MSIVEMAELEMWGKMQQARIDRLQAERDALYRAACNLLDSSMDQFAERLEALRDVVCDQEGCA